MPTFTPLHTSASRLAAKFVTGLATLLLVIFCCALSLPAQQTSSAQAQSTAIRVTSPLQNQRLTANFIDVHFQLTNPTAAAASSPNFRIQLDSRDPVTTTTTSQNFTGLTPGTHVLTVELVDANGTVIRDSQTQVQFTVLATPQNGPGPSTQDTTGTETTRPAPQARVGATPQDQAIAQAGTSLSILSLIGFGVLFGGVVSAMKTR